MGRFTWFAIGMLRLLGKEPWSERRRGERRASGDRRHIQTATVSAPERRECKSDRRKDDRRGRGWLRFWNPD
jgi:hypothetical protein